MTYNKAIIPDEAAVYREVIQKDFPALPIRAIEVIGSGEGRVAILVNDEIVFRLPSGASAAAQEDIQNTKMEYQVLVRLGAVPFQIPRPIYMSPDERYFGYKVLEGKNSYDSLSGGSVPDMFLDQWVTARKSISQALSLTDARALGVPMYSWDTELHRAKALPAGVLSLYVQSRLKNDADYITASNFESELEFTHNDLNLDNLLVNESGELIGVLDFGDAHIAPRSTDYYLWDKWPHEVMERVAKIAAGHHDEFDVRLARAVHRMYVGSDLYESIKQNDSLAINMYVTELERCYGA